MAPAHGVGGGDEISKDPFRFNSCRTHARDDASPTDRCRAPISGHWILAQGRGLPVTLPD